MRPTPMLENIEDRPLPASLPTASMGKLLHGTGTESTSVPQNSWEPGRLDCLHRDHSLAPGFLQTHLSCRSQPAVPTLSDSHMQVRLRLRRNSERVFQFAGSKSPKPQPDPVPLLRTRHSCHTGPRLLIASNSALVDHKIPQEDVVQSEPDLRWSRIRHYMREPFSEFFGVFILIMFGDGVVAQVVLSKEVKG